GEWSAQQQVAAYLASTGGVADPNALYTVYIGINDLKTSSIPNIIGNTAAITALGQQAAGLVGSLYSAGGRYFLVPNAIGLNPAAAAASGGGFNQSVVDSRALYSQTMWNGIAAQGINFIPADVSTVWNYVLTNPAQFGILVTNVFTPACNNPANTNAYQCGPGNYVTPNANQTYFFADVPGAPDGGGHVTGAVQRIEA